MYVVYIPYIYIYTVPISLECWKSWKNGEKTDIFWRYHVTAVRIQPAWILLKKTCFFGNPRVCIKILLAFWAHNFWNLGSPPIKEFLHVESLPWYLQKSRSRENFLMTWWRNFQRKVGTKHKSWMVKPLILRACLLIMGPARFWKTLIFSRNAAGFHFFGDWIFEMFGRVWDALTKFHGCGRLLLSWCYFGNDLIRIDLTLKIVVANLNLNQAKSSHFPLLQKHSFLVVVVCRKKEMKKKLSLEVNKNNAIKKQMFLQTDFLERSGLTIEQELLLVPPCF